MTCVSSPLNAKVLLCFMGGDEINEQKLSHIYSLG